jgi:hypothetical protein
MSSNELVFLHDEHCFIEVFIHCIVFEGIDSVDFVLGISLASEY